MQHFRSIAGTACAVAMSLAVAGPAFAQAYPNKPVTVIVAFASGGPIDLETRLYVPRVSEQLGQPLVIEYKLGQGTALGSGHVAKARPDGYTILSNSAALTVFPAFYKNLDFDVVKDFAPVTQMSKRSSLLQASNLFPARTFADYIAYARANPGKINYGTAGVGDISHLVGEWLHSLTSTRVTFVPFKGTGPILTELMAGRVDVTSGTLIAALPLVRAGKVRPLAMLGDKRSKHMPDVPTVAEHNLPEFDYANWLGIFAPAGTPAPIVNRLNDAFVKVSRLPAIVAELDAQGSDAVGSSPEQFRKYVASETARWGRVVQGAGIKLAE